MKDLPVQSPHYLLESYHTHTHEPLLDFKGSIKMFKIRLKDALYRLLSYFNVNSHRIIDSLSLNCSLIANTSAVFPI